MTDDFDSDYKFCKDWPALNTEDELDLPSLAANHFRHGPEVGLQSKIERNSRVFENLQWRGSISGIPESDLVFENTESGPQFAELDISHKSFSYFLNNKLLNHVASQSSVYVKQRDIGNKFSCTSFEIRQLLGMLRYMPVLRYPNLLLY